MSATVEALPVEHVGHVVSIVIEAIEDMPADQSTAPPTRWRRSIVPGRLFPMNVSPWEHLQFSVGSPSTSWEGVEGGDRRRNGGTVASEIEVRWLYALRIDQSAEDYEVAVGAIERGLLSTIRSRCRRRGVRVSLISADRVEDPGLVAEKELPAVWLIGIVRLRADHRYLYDLGT